ncbi:cytochrome P450 [Streptomyces lavendulae]|uniref:cytochrome P450 n=1 Tax=Streptomyces lavendulae TaxID=1914 RepID=UPI0024A54312|nr:cytochrome P450 [Streptomyces lavendulae]GLX21708.1 cytochrome P450 [Streptomyces lavendulae subsp. lavendulae]GLX29125.1 cytochrome P450 [Streptomyces lavendulae subsp. lavendulae]
MNETVHHLSPDLLQDPAAGYAGLRDGDGLPRVVLPGLRTPVRLVTRYEDVRAALTEPRLIRDRGRVPGGAEGPDAQEELLEPLGGLPPEYARYVSAHLAFLDGEEHARLRTPLTRAFTARGVAALRPFVEDSAERLIGELAGREEADLLNEFAYPLATSVICELVGVDAADRARVCDWIRDFAYGDGSRMADGLSGVVEYVRSLIARRKAGPADDLITALLEGAREGGAGALDEEEITAMVFLLINTGITPPALFLAHAVLALLDHPGQLARLRAEPALLGRAVPELLRHVTLLRIGATLYAAEDFVFAGTPLRRGESVTVALLAANHDPAVYGEAPARLDVTREAGRGRGHLAFGHGAHHCIGAALGNLVTGVVFERLLVRRPVPELAVPREELEFGHWPGDGFHLLRLPVRL